MKRSSLVAASTFYVLSQLVFGVVSSSAGAQGNSSAANSQSAVPDTYSALLPWMDTAAGKPGTAGAAARVIMFSGRVVAEQSAR